MGKVGITKVGMKLGQKVVIHFSNTVSVSYAGDEKYPGR